jgi:molecular chaperone GrpE (heat shock protein)
MTNSDVPNPEREEVSVDGISIKGKADRNGRDGKSRRPATDADAGAETGRSGIDEARDNEAGIQERSGTKEQNLQSKADGGGETPREKAESRDDIELLKKRLEEQEKLTAEYLDLLKRKQADFENFRKRSQKEIDENKRYATTEVVLDILNLIDDFERAVESTRSSKEFDVLIDGVLLIRKQFGNLLEKKYGVKSIEARGKEFDPTLHDAVMVDETGGYDKDTVIEDLRKGYMMHDRIIRPSKVKVAKAAEKTADNSDKSNERG